MIGRASRGTFPGREDRMAGKKVVMESRMKTTAIDTVKRTLKLVFFWLSFIVVGVGVGEVVIQ